MKFLTVQEAFRRKFERQDSIDGLEYHASGHCVHVGKLSPGCQKCFVPDSFSVNLHIGSECNANCPYCPGGAGMEGFSGQDMLARKGKLLQKAVKANTEHIIPTVSFTGGGEPLVYLDVISDFMAFYRSIEELIGVKPWYYLYTNGILADLDTILRLKDLGFDEIRFHLGASNFSERVYENMAEAVRHLNTVTVETPAWPLHREKLFEMLPLIEEIGVKHLNLGEVWLTEHNKEAVAKLIPDAEVYQCRYVHLYDGGLAYDVIEEVLARGYSFSVLDCSCLVKSIQGTHGKWVMHDPVDGLCRRPDLERALT
jgi:hypothetical protein